MSSLLRRTLSITAASTCALALLACAPRPAGEETSSGGRASLAEGREGDRAERRDGGGFSLFERTERRDLPEGTSVTVRLTDSVESGTASVGQDVSGVVASSVSADGRVVIPDGSRVKGEVAEVRSAKRFGGQAMIAVEFREIEVAGGADVPVSGRIEAYGKKQTGKDTATIAGSAAGGAILGEILDDKPVEGAIVGGGIGTAVASRRGDEAELNAGREVVVHTTSGVRLQAASD
jgi:hypothetical protein